MAMPLIAAQLLQMGNGLCDSLVAGRLGREALAASGIGASLWFFSSLLCIGLMAGLSPILSALIGQRRRAEIGHFFRQGLWLAITVGVGAMVLVLSILYLLPYSGIQPELLPLMRQYLLGAVGSLPAFAVVMACRNVCEATGVTRPVLLVTTLGLLINIAGNLTLGLGWLGFPRLGLAGIGLTTTLVMFCMAAALLMLLHRHDFKRYQLFSGFDRPDAVRIKQILHLSVPIFFTLLFEAGLFIATMVQMGILGTLEAGSHLIAISVTSFCYMLPLGLSFALTARVGRIHGRLEEIAANSSEQRQEKLKALQLEALKLRICSGLLLTLLMALATSILILLLRLPVTRLYTPDVELQVFASRLMLYAALFQLSDAAQVSLLGMLRGLQDTRLPMLINAFSYWVVAFALGYFSAHHLGFGADGLWAGLICGLTVAALLLAYRLHSQVSKIALSRTA